MNIEEFEREKAAFEAKREEMMRWRAELLAEVAEIDRVLGGEPATPTKARLPAPRAGKNQRLAAILKAFEGQPSGTGYTYHQLLSVLRIAPGSNEAVRVSSALSNAKKNGLIACNKGIYSLPKGSP